VRPTCCSQVGPASRRRDKPDSVVSYHSSGSDIAITLKQSTREPVRVTLSALLFDLAPHRVWLFSLCPLPDELPFPLIRSMLQTFSLFHCSSPCGGGSLTPVSLFGVRTFLQIFGRPKPFSGPSSFKNPAIAYACYVGNLYQIGAISTRVHLIISELDSVYRRDPITTRL
jgi:hypothetical protein